MHFSPLSKKLFRDLWETKGQALAAALVVGAGVGLYILLLSTYWSLELTRESYYERYRMADIFVSCKRAPLNLRDSILKIPGVSQVQARVVADVTLEVEGLDEPALGRLVSLPEGNEPGLCGIFLRKGRLPKKDSPDEVLASENFFRANKLRLGDSFFTVINEKKRKLKIVGVALSPEYVYAIRPGEIFPDDKRFGIFWMNRRALASAFNMEGGFNSLLVKLRKGFKARGVIERLDKILERYGGIGALPKERQISNWYLSNELKQLKSWGTVVPAVFLFVAGFLVNIALSRLVAVQRRQIGVLKALGYTDGQIALHYLSWALFVCTLGSALGVAVGIRFGKGLTELYAQFFRFPFLIYQLLSLIHI